MTLASQSHLPMAKTLNLITTETATDLLVFDTEQNQLHTLNAVAASVWRAADGTRSVSALAVACDLDLTSTENALSQLSNANLLENNQGFDTAFTTRSSRRRLLKQAGVAGAVSIPVIISISAPAAAQNESGIACGDVCVSTNNQCNSRCSQCEEFAPEVFQCCNPGGQHGFPCPS